jgi:hypothetical protein
MNDSSEIRESLDLSRDGCDGRLIGRTRVVGQVRNYPSPILGVAASKSLEPFRTSLPEVRPDGHCISSSFSRTLCSFSRS